MMPRPTAAATTPGKRISLALWPQSQAHAPVADVTGQTGSSRYMAPEVHRSEQYGTKVDVYSFGILAYEVLAKRRAYEERLMTMDQVAAAVSNSGLRPTLPPRWPPALRDLISSCWAQRALDRPIFTEVRAKLEELVAQAEATEAGEPNELLDALTPKSSACCVVC